MSVLGDIHVSYDNYPSINKKLKLIIHELINNNKQ